MGNLNEEKKKRKIGNLDDEKMPYDYHEREYGTVPTDTKRKPFRWVSEVAYKNVHRIVARGYDTTELVEEGYGLVDLLFIDFQARIPLIEEEKMLNYVMIMALEDGLSMPAALSRIVAQSKTFLTQACGASILAFGHAYGAYSAFGNRLEEYLKKAEEQGKTTADIAAALAKENLNDESLGVSSLMLKDPAAKRMFARAENLDMLGATGATMMDLGFTPEATWAILAITRAFAAGAHYIEELERASYTRLGQTLTPKEDYDGPPDRPVPDPKDRDKIAKPAQTHTTKEWKKAFEERKKIHGSGFAIVEEIEDPSKKTGIKKVGR